MFFFFTTGLDRLHSVLDFLFTLLQGNIRFTVLVLCMRGMGEQMDRDQQTDSTYLIMTGYQAAAYSCRQDNWVHTHTHTHTVRLVPGDRLTANRREEVKTPEEYAHSPS